MEALKNIRVAATPLLKNCQIQDIVYRPYDMGLFGGRGYSLVLYNPENDKILGINFGDTTPNEQTIIRGVNRILDQIAI